MIRRREFIMMLGGAAAAWPVAARAQQPRLPVIGYLFAGSTGPMVETVMVAFRRALAEHGYVEGQSVAIEYRYAEGQYDRLPELAADLVRRNVSVIVAAANVNSARAAMAASATIPIVFMVGDDPSKLGLVASLNRPGGNATGVNYFLAEIVVKRLGLLRELLPAAARFGVMVNPNSSATETTLQELTAAASALGVQTEVVRARDGREIEAAFVSLIDNRAEGLFVAPDTFFATRRVQITTLAARHAIPAIYTVREYVDVGGLISYGTSLTEVYRQLGLYAGRILKGAKPTDLPVVQSTKIELVINLATARALGIKIPPSLLAIADEVIE
jgi:putative ABC transport system substrate-binding protein